MTPQEKFNAALDKLNYSELQKVEIKILALELGRDEWKVGFERNQEITMKTLNILG